MGQRPNGSGETGGQPLQVGHIARGHPKIAFQNSFIDR